jgi:hypothetical protein
MLNLRKNRNTRLTTDIVNQRLKNRGFAMIGEYSAGNVKSLFRCPEGHEWSTRPANILSGSGCPSCSFAGFDPNQLASWSDAALGILFYFMRIRIKPIQINHLAR